MLLALVPRLAAAKPPSTPAQEEPESNQTSMVSVPLRQRWAWSA